MVQRVECLLLPSAVAVQIQTDSGLLPIRGDQHLGDAGNVDSRICEFVANQLFKFESQSFGETF